MLIYPNKKNLKHTRLNLTLFAHDIHPVHFAQFRRHLIVFECDEAKGLGSARVAIGASLFYFNLINFFKLIKPFIKLNLAMLGEDLLN